MNKNMATFRMNSKCEFNQARKRTKNLHTHTQTHKDRELIKLVAGIVSSANTQMGKQKLPKKGKSSEVEIYVRESKSITKEKERDCKL